MAESRLCSIEGCGKRAIARGWCPMHYQRWRVHGDVDTVRGTPPGGPMEFVHELVGSSETAADCVIWPFARKSSGYGHLWCDGRVKAAHRVVCEMVNGPPPSDVHHAAHLCGNGHLGCVNPNHLAWKTPVENKADELVHGTRNVGLRNGRGALSDEDVRAIRATNEQPLKDVARRFGVSKGTVSRIRNGTRRVVA